MELRYIQSVGHDLAFVVMSEPAKIFRVPRWLLVFLCLIFLATASGGLLLYRTDGLSFASAGLVVFAIFALIGVADSLVTRVELGDDALTLVERFRRRRVLRRDIERVTWEAGVGVSIQLRSGDWVRLPDTGNSQSRANSIRAWLKR